MNQDTLIQVRDLHKSFPVGRGLFGKATSYTNALNGISFSIKRGASLALVGESGSGKTTTGKLLTGLIAPTSGQIELNLPGGPINMATLDRSSYKRFRRHVQMIFQDPYESLNPRRTIFDTVAEPLVVQKIGNVVEQQQRAAAMLQMVGLTPASSFLFRYPHELSGGQRQRVAIARALIVEPSFVVADEPTSMLDVSIRTGVMKLMQDLAERLGLTYLYITHDLAVARYMASEIAVMYKGNIVEHGPTEEVLHHPQHEYTRALLAAVPVPDPRVRRAIYA
jgi:ABC-type oligopeptide transport system ATPase subunit